MPQLAPDITLALSQFFQNDDPGLALMHALEGGAPSNAATPSPIPDTVQPITEPTRA
jgi:hypothetical protein